MKISKFFLFFSIGLILILFGFTLGRNVKNDTLSISELPAVTDTIPASLKLDINSITASELDSLPGIGPVLASRIVEFRTQHGPFSDISQLLQVDGIGKDRLESLKEYITVGGSYENTGS